MCIKAKVRLQPDEYDGMQSLDPPTCPTVPWSNRYQISFQNECLDAAHESAPHTELSDDLGFMHTGPRKY